MGFLKKRTLRFEHGRAYNRKGLSVKKPSRTFKGHSSLQYHIEKVLQPLNEHFKCLWSRTNFFGCDPDAGAFISSFRWLLYSLHKNISVQILREQLTNLQVNKAAWFHMQGESCQCGGDICRN